MIKKLFGETEEEQFNYLKTRLLVLTVGIVLLILGILLLGLKVQFGEILCQLGQVVCVIDLLIFGWAIMRGLFGFATIGALFSGNIILGTAIFVLFILTGYLAGIFVAIIGLCRIFVLLKKRK